ncbi:MAG: hypothetical protein IJL78_09245 [Lachnospiraceae bacterium]|nr:hypothetical protein [Lachnospiraceae bacterium]
MNYFVEGLQGSGKSTIVRKISEKIPGSVAVREGDYSPVELAWCAYVDKAKYREILGKYPELRAEIEEKTFAEGEKRIICYTKILTDVPGFHKDLAQYEIYNGRTPYEDFRGIVLSRYRKWNTDNMIFECSLFQNTVEDMILYRCFSDEEIVGFYRQAREALNGKDYRIVYLKAEDIPGNLRVIRKERSDEHGKELWFPLMIWYFNKSPYAKKYGFEGEDALLRHFRHRQDLELRIMEEIFPDQSVTFTSKGYTDEDLAKL